VVGYSMKWHIERKHILLLLLICGAVLYLINSHYLESIFIGSFLFYLIIALLPLTLYVYILEGEKNGTKDKGNVLPVIIEHDSDNHSENVEASTEGKLE